MASRVYLCFTFGTDHVEAWPEISKTLGTQSRVVMHPDGFMRLSQLGEGIEEAILPLSAMRKTKSSTSMPREHVLLSTRDS